MSHIHAAVFQAAIDGDIKSWECRRIEQEQWRPAASWLEFLIDQPTEWEIRRKPQPKVIDWSQLGKHVPVRVWDENQVFAGGYIRFLHELFDGSEPFGDGLDTWECASLDTGLWVYNHDGGNPWPEGCLIECHLRNGKQGSIYSPGACSWGIQETGYDIIASRFHSLEPGYSFGGEE